MARRRGQNFDYLIAVCVALLLVIGFAALASASSDLGKLEYNDAYYYIKHQALYGLAVGALGFLLAFYLDYRKYKKFSPILFFISVGALILTFTPLGHSAGGASRWLALGPITLQPSELLKLFFIFYLAAWLSGKSERNKSVTEGLVPFLSISGLIAALLLAQRSTSAFILIMLGAFAVYFVGGADKKHVMAVIGIGLLLITVVIFKTEYRADRIKSFLDPGADVQDSGYQVSQALTTIGSGELTGVGYGQSTIKTSLPERIGDSIFAVIAEEFGFVGSIFLISVFLVFITRVFLLARRTRDQFGKLLLVGFATIIGAQAFIHIGGNSGLIPLTGVPLPFISYGGSALAVFMIMSGVILNISKKT